MSTENCKKFIEEISVEQNLPLKTTWKRIELYKDNHLTFRKFENKEGDEILLSESKDGIVQLVELEINIIVPESIKQANNSQKLLSELYKLCLDLSIHDENIEHESLNPLSPNAIRKYLLLGDDSYLQTELKDYTPSHEKDYHISHYVMASLAYEDYGLLEQFKSNFMNDTDSKNVGIDYDLENMMAYYCEKEGISFFKAVCGGDWELPVHFLIYWSPKEERLKGFFPRDDSNTYNTLYDCAYGSESNKINEEDFLNKESYDQAITDADTHMDKINDNFDNLSEKALKKAFKQMKKIIINESLQQSPKP